MSSAFDLFKSFKKEKTKFKIAKKTERSLFGNVQAARLPSDASRFLKKRFVRRSCHPDLA
jgi:hypothetical protein